MDRKPLTSDEKAVQRKVERGIRVNNDDRRIIQARKRSMQKRGNYIGAHAIPGRTLTKSVGVDATKIVSAVRDKANSLDSDKAPVWGSSGLQQSIDMCRYMLEWGGAGIFGATAHNTNGLNTKWTVSGNMTMQAAALRDSGGGTASTQSQGGTGVTGQSASGSQQQSGWGVNGGAGGSQSAGASMPYSGATISGGAGTGYSASAGYSSSQGSSQSQGGTTGTSSTGGNTVTGNEIREAYFSKVNASFTITMEPEGDWQDFWGQGSKETSGTCEDCGEIQFEVSVPA